jgi:Spy/CpxP family protein refolding chaperone
VAGSKQERKMKKRLVLVLGAALVLTVAGIALGFGPRLMKDTQRIHKMISWKVDDMLDEIKATPNQRSQVNSVKDRILQEGTLLMKEHQGFHEELTAQWNSNNPDAGKIHSLIDSKSEQFRAFAHKAVDGMLEIHRALTPEQRAKLAQEHEKHQHQGCPLR